MEENRRRLSATNGNVTKDADRVGDGIPIGPQSHTVTMVSSNKFSAGCVGEKQSLH